jgi:hypothetical protein
LSAAPVAQNAKATARSPNPNKKEDRKTAELRDIVVRFDIADKGQLQNTDEPTL